MKGFQASVGYSLKGKIEEHTFFLERIVATCALIEIKHLTQNYPINPEIDWVNYYFSAYLNTIQSLKDACQTAMKVTYDWKTLSPSYGDFIFYCRNAATHDGCQLINSGFGTKNYITGKLSRINGRGKLEEVEPPKEDIVSLCINISSELAKSLRCILSENGAAIPTTDGAVLENVTDNLLGYDFIPEIIKNMIVENKEEIQKSLRNANFEVLPQTYGALDQLDGFISKVKA